MSALRPRGLPALTAPDEPPIFSSSSIDSLESSWAGRAGGGPSFSHPWIAASKGVVRNIESLSPICLDPKTYPGPAARQQERVLEQAEGAHVRSQAVYTQCAAWRGGEMVTDGDLGVHPAGEACLGTLA